MDTLTDEQLILLARTQAAAFETLLRRHAPMIHRLAASVVGPGTADDVVQEVLISVHKNIGSFRGEAKFSTWLHRVTVNACSAALRKRQPDPLEHAPEIVAANSPAQAGERAQLRERLAWAMSRLPPDQREAVTLREIGELEYAEIAEVTGVEIGTVKSRISRGRAALRDLLTTRWDVPSRQGVQT
jgi:RNA polymerase sigma-70 factor, ECF subfamily